MGANRDTGQNINLGSLPNRAPVSIAFGEECLHALKTFVRHSTYFKNPNVDNLLLWTRNLTAVGLPSILAVIFLWTTLLVINPPADVSAVP